MNPHGPHGGHGPHGPHGPHSHGPHHYQPYPDLSSPSPVPHSPASHGADTSPFNGHPGSGGGGGGGNGGGNSGGNGGNPHQHHLQVSMDTHHGGHMGPGHHHQLHNHHHHINNNNNSTNNNNKNNGGHACAGCGGKILERYLLHALDRYWHHGCLKCTCCAGQLADLGTSCFTKGGMILCKADYARLFGNTGACSACGQTIPASEFVMRVGGGPGTPSAPSPLHVFHLKCFSCSKCGSQLVPGDRYHLLGGALVCEQDWHKLIKGGGAAGVPAGPGATPGVRKGKVGRPRRSRD